MRDIIANGIIEAKFSNRSVAKPIFTIIKDRNLQDDVAEIVVEIIALGINNTKALTSVLTMIGNRVYSLLEIEETDIEKIIRLGGAFIDVTTKLNLTNIKKYAVIEKDAQEQWFLVITDETFQNIIKDYAMPKLKANLGYQEWLGPVMNVADRKIDIVKKARRYGLLSKYRKTQMPDVYDALNALGQTEWKINTDMLSILDIPANNTNLIPQPISKDDKKRALTAINKNERTAIWLADIKFKQYVENGYEDAKAEHFANKNADDLKNEKNKPYKDIISVWSKEKDFRTCLDVATKYGNDTLNFLYSCDSRGRVYCFNQSFLNPQGADHAKALLKFANPKPISTYDFYVTIANHAGQDKLSYDDRIEWVKANEINILEVGVNPWSEYSMSWMNETGIAQEAKSKFQFIAAAQEYVKLIKWIEDGNNQDDFLCSIPVAYDATNSGLQILSAIGRDETVAPHVNITKTDKPGDIYKFIGTNAWDAIVEAIPSLKPINKNDKVVRKFVKRNVMTKNYAATRYGMGLQQWDDKPDEKDDSTGIWNKLSFEDCKLLGGIVYDTCSQYLPLAHQLMETMKTAVSYTTKSVVSWKLPSGFTAFQSKDKSERNQVKVTIGNVKPQLVYYTFTDKPNKAQHRSAIAPDVVHSIDAWLLVSIINKLPTDANLAFVHDAFGSDSCYGSDIQDVAKECYYTVSSRTVMENILLQISGFSNDCPALPAAGNWKPEELFEADYLVC